MADLYLLVDLVPEGDALLDYFFRAFGHQLQSHGGGGQDGVDVAAPGDVAFHRAPFLGLHHHVPLHDEGGGVFEADFQSASVFYFYAGCHQAAGRIQTDGGHRLRDGHHARFHQGGAHADGVVAAHGQPAAGLEIHDPDIRVLPAGRAEEGAGHDGVAPGFQAEQAADPVVMLHHVRIFFHHGGAGDDRHAGKDGAGRLAAGMGVDGVEHTSGIHT